MTGIEEVDKETRKPGKEKGKGKEKTDDAVGPNSSGAHNLSAMLFQGKKYPSVNSRKDKKRHCEPCAQTADCAPVLIVI